MKHLNVFLFFLAICFATVGPTNAADYDSKMDAGALSTASLYCFEDSYTGGILEVNYDPATGTLVGTFGIFGPVYGIYYNDTLVWSFDANYPDTGNPVTYVGDIINGNPLTFETYWINLNGYKDGPYSLTQISCP